MTTYRFALWLLAAIAIAPLWSAPVHALAPAATETAESSAQTEQVIEATQDEGSDQRIESRLKDIFSELPAFQAVSVEVNEGVVSLSGTVSDSESINRAANIAARVSGVVTVENSLERDLSVENNLSVIGKTSGLLKGFLELLPLLGIAVVTAFLIGAIGYFIAGFSPLWSRIAPNAFLADLLRSAIRFAFVVGGIIIALDMLGASTLMGAVLGGAGVIGIALGFAMRDTVENYVASLMLSLRQPFRANDHVLIDDKEGRVIRLTSRATVLMTLDGNHLRIPNGQVFKAVILNFTRNPKRRFEFELRIDADDDPRAAMKLGVQILRDLNFVQAEPEPSAQIQGVGDSNIVIRFLGWIDQREADWNKSRSHAIAAVKVALEDAGFALPEPIYRLRFDGRTDPLPIGRSAVASESVARPSQPKKPAPSTPEDADVKPESEIAEMVEQDRISDGGQGEDLLDPGRPVE